MKYIAVFEVPDDEIGLLELTVSAKDGLTTTSLVEYKKAPECFTEDLLEKCDYKSGYNDALKDCGVTK